MMETDALIKRLAADLKAGSQSPLSHDHHTRLALATFGVGLGTVMLLATSLGVRPDLASASVTPAVALKLLPFLALAVGAYFLAAKWMQPGATGSAFGLMPGIILLLAGLVANPVAITSASDFAAAALQGSPMICMAMIVAFSLVPLGVLLNVMRGGASTRPSVAGGVAGILAGSLGAFAYGLHCPIDSTVFVAIWYGASIAFVGLIGAVLGRWLLAW